MKFIQTKFNLIITPAILATLLWAFNIYENSTIFAAADMVADGLVRKVTKESLRSFQEHKEAKSNLTKITSSFSGSGLENIFVFDEQNKLLIGTTEINHSELNLAKHPRTSETDECLYIIRTTDTISFTPPPLKIPSNRLKEVDRQENHHALINEIEGAYIVYVFSKSTNAINKDTKFKISNILITMAICFIVIFAGLFNQLIIVNNLIRTKNNTEKKLKKHKIEQICLEQKISKIRKEEIEENIKKRKTTNFLVNICHDIKTPINVLIAEVQQKNLDSPIIKSAEKQLNMLIDDLASASRITSGDFKFAKEIFYWNCAVSESITLSKSALSFTGNYNQYCEFISMTSAYYAETIINDERRIKQMLSNLINNAIKYSKSCTIITHTSLIKIENQNYIECNVIDYGLGIRKSIQRDVFEAFTQVNENKPLMETGHGLGLSIIKTFAEKMNGTVHIHSNNPSGLRVGFRIPVNDVEAQSITHRIKNLKSGQPVAIVSGCPELAFAISDKLYSCQTIHYLSLNDLSKDNANKHKIKHVIMGLDSIDNTMEMDHLELHNLGRTTTIHGPKERARELIDGWKKYTFESLSILNSEFTRIDTKPSTRILVVEDIQANIPQYRNLCKDLNYSLSICLNAHQARLLLNAQKFDLVFIDILLDEDECMDYGYDLSLFAKATINRDTPFIAVTGTAFNEMKSFYLRCNVSATITKARGTTDTEKDIIKSILENPSEVHGEKQYYEGEPTPEVINILDLLHKTDDPTNTYDLILKLSKECNSEYANQCAQQVWRYLERPENTHLIKHCTAEILDYFGYKNHQAIDSSMPQRDPKFF